MDQFYRDGRCPQCERHEASVEERYSLGIYAMTACARCWDESGYRKEGREGFDPLYAGERYEEEG